MDAHPDAARRVTVGARVEVELIERSGASERLAFEIVPDVAADFAGGFLGQGTPLARAILGQPVGVTVAYSVGELRAARILSVMDGTSSAKELADARKAAADKVVLEIERGNAIAFASSFSGKWGDYDPEGVEKWEQDQQDHKKPG